MSTEFVLSFFRHLFTKEKSEIYGNEGLNTLHLNDLLKYIGAVYMMDVYSMPRSEMHWTNKHYKSLLLTNVMTSDQFSKVRNNIKMPEGQTAHYMIQSIQNKMSTILKPSSHICIDEMLRKFISQFGN